MRLGALQPGEVAYSHQASDGADDSEASVVAHQRTSELVGHCNNAPMPMPAEEDDDPRVAMIKRGDVAVCTHAKLARRETRRKERRRGLTDVAALSCVGDVQRRRLVAE